MQLKWMHIQMAWCVRMFNSFWQASTTFKIMHFECVVTVLCRASHAYDQKKTILTEPASAWCDAAHWALYIFQCIGCASLALKIKFQRECSILDSISICIFQHIFSYITQYIRYVFLFRKYGNQKKNNVKIKCELYVRILNMKPSDVCRKQLNIENLKKTSKYNKINPRLFKLILDNSFLEFSEFAGTYL